MLYITIASATLSFVCYQNYTINMLSMCYRSTIQNIYISAFNHLKEYYYPTSTLQMLYICSTSDVPRLPHLYLPVLADKGDCCLLSSQWPRQGWPGPCSPSWLWCSPAQPPPPPGPIGVLWWRWWRLCVGVKRTIQKYAKVQRRIQKIAPPLVWPLKTPKTIMKTNFGSKSFPSFPKTTFFSCEFQCRYAKVSIKTSQKEEFKNNSAFSEIQTPRTRNSHTL